MHEQRRSRLPGGSAAPVRLPTDRLSELTSLPGQYREFLTRALFADDGLGPAFEKARTVAEVSQMQLRIRIEVEDSARELHAVRWELLGDPRKPEWPLFAGRAFSLSRFVSSPSSRPLDQPRGRRLKALFLAANPRNSGAFPIRLPPLDVASETQIATTRLRGMRVTRLTGSGLANREKLRAEINNGPDILYLAAHGVISGGSAQLLLEGANAQAEPVSGLDLASWIAFQPQIPRLALLASCNSAGGEAAIADPAVFLSTMGPLLAFAGIPAVIGMQGAITEETSLAFFNALFETLTIHGDVESAMADARERVMDRPDWWMPVLFLSLADGQLWSARSHHEEFKSWDSLLKMIDRKQCTPVLGSGLVEDFLGSNRLIAREWVRKYEIPVAQGWEEQLPQVAQMLKKEGPEKPREELDSYYWNLLRQAKAGQEETRDARGISRAVTRLGRGYRKAHAPDIHDVLARLGCDFYLCTKTDNLMADALSDLPDAKTVLVRACPWKQDEESQSELFWIDADWRPNPNETLVYHLFGHLSDFDSIVLTEDDYFDLMIWLAEHRQLIPSWMKPRLVDNMLLFLGFRLDDWEFRVLLRSIAKLKGANRMGRHPHIAVQLDTPAGDPAAHEKLRTYLEEYFGRTDIPLKIYWGSVQEFAEELNDRLDAQTDAAGTAKAVGV